MGYCFMTTQKIKSMGTLASKFNHNYRKVEVSNADPDLFDKNEELVRCMDDHGNEIDYTEAWKKRMEDLPHYQKFGTRKNAVLAIEVVTTFSREDHIDLEKWKEENVKWLEKTYNVAPDGKSNVISMVYHADEPGNVHCHAIITPVDERGRLNASRFIGSRRALSEMQTDYGNAMKQFGLKRGLENGQARHEDIKKFYADLNNSIQVSLPQKGETAMEYRDRVLEELETAQAAALRERREQQRLIEREIAEKRIAFRQEIAEERKGLSNERAEMKKEIEKENEELVREIKRNSETIKKQKDTIKSNTDRLSGLEDKYEEQRFLYDDLLRECMEKDKDKKKIRFYDTFQKQYKLLKEQYPDRAQDMAENMTLMGRLRETEKERETP